MAIDPSVKFIEARFLCRWITVAQLKSILADLSDKDTLHPNCVGNLAVFCGHQQIGYIDIYKEQFVYTYEEV